MKAKTMASICIGRKQFPFIFIGFLTFAGNLNGALTPSSSTVASSSSASSPSPLSSLETSSTVTNRPKHLQHHHHAHHQAQHVYHYPHHHHPQQQPHYLLKNHKIQWAPRTTTGQFAVNATRAVSNIVTNVNHGFRSLFRPRPKSRSSHVSLSSSSSLPASPLLKLFSGENILSAAASRLFQSSHSSALSGGKLFQSRKAIDTINVGSSLNKNSAKNNSGNENGSRRFVSGVVGHSHSTPSSLSDHQRSESVVNEVSVNMSSSSQTTNNQGGTTEAPINFELQGERLRDDLVGRVATIQTALTHAIEFSKERREYISNKLLEQTNLRLEQAKERTHRFLSDPRNQEMAARTVHNVNQGLSQANNWFQSLVNRAQQTILDRAAARVQMQQRLKEEAEQRRQEEARAAAVAAAAAAEAERSSNTTSTSTTTESSTSTTIKSNDN